MKKILQHFIPLVLLLATVTAGWSQSSPDCVTYSDDDHFIGTLFFNNGSTSNAFNTNFRTNITYGQPLIGNYFGQGHQGAFGFWARFLLAPGAPAVIASEGDLEDRVEIDWTDDPLSPAAALGFNIYRDGALLAHVDPEVNSFIDFNVIAGKYYTYEVSGVNTFGEGSRGSSLGFLNPNGVLTGQIKSVCQNPVVNAIVTLTPTLGTALSFDGTDDMAFSENNPVFPRSQFTISCWVKLNGTNDNTGIFDFGSNIGKNWWLHTLPAPQTGIKFGVGKGSTSSVTEMTYAFPTASADTAWHNIAASYNGNTLMLYVDGELVASTTTTISSSDDVPLFFGRKAGSPSGAGGFFNGKLDEVRLFNEQLPQTTIQTYMNRSVDSETEGLIAYWKFDEGVGAKGFDQSPTNQKVYLCGPSWTTIRPDVVNSGITDATGFYRIGGINYGAGTTFTAVPSKSFYLNQSLEFNPADATSVYANLTNFPLTDSATVSVTLKPFDLFSTTVQKILVKSNSGNTQGLLLSLQHDSLKLTINNNQSYFIGTLAPAFHQVTMTLRKSGTSLIASCYMDGVLSAGSPHTFTTGISDWTGNPWQLGAAYNGLIDEAVFYNTLLPLSDIQAAANVGTDPANHQIVHYFNLNEGSGTTLFDVIDPSLGTGTTYSTTWSNVVEVPMAIPHEFTPASSLVTLNPSSTSVDQINFTDESTVPVTGYVRFDGTTCFAGNVEILVNGVSNVPQIMTDENGYFSADFEPGEDVKLQPVFENHTFSPPFWELDNLVTPIAGILFKDQTKRKVVGQLAGGHCFTSIIPSGAIVKVKVATLNGCYSQVLTLSTLPSGGDGKFTFSGVPPDSVTVAVIEHSNPVIYDYFQNLGGVTLDLKEADDTTNFIYYAPPQVELSAIADSYPDCPGTQLDQNVQYQTTVRVFESYDGGLCYLDTAQLTFNNNIADLEQFDTLMTSGQLIHKFNAGGPDIVSPYLKTLQVTAEAHSEEATATADAVVLGTRPRTSTFATTSPEIPTLILRDPPGDGSSAYIEEDETTCVTVSFSATDKTASENDLKLSLAPDINTSVGVGAEVDAEVDNTEDLNTIITSTFTALTTNEQQTCTTFTQNISTGDNDVVVGSEMGGDVYMGGATNYIFGITDELIWNDTTCIPYLDQGLSVANAGYATTFIYTEFHILNVVIPQLMTIGDTASAVLWQNNVDYNTQLKQQAVFSQNFSFDAGIVYQESETTEVTNTLTNEFDVEFSQDFVNEFGTTVDGVGLVDGITIGVGVTEATSVSTSTDATTTVGYTLADDDIGDNFSVNVLKDKTYGTPVFVLVSGQTSCPNEPNSQPRDGVSIVANQNVAVNVPMNDEAVFILTLGNTSQSGEARTYTLSADQLSNPNGAIIRFNGETSLTVELEFGVGMDVTMTVERGPLAFDYTGLSVSFGSDCDGNFSQSLLFDVHYLQPCSEVDVTFPMDNWVLLPSDGPILNITTALYDVTDPELELIRVQYRRTNGDGAWINIATIEKADLGPVFTITDWNTGTLQDDLYDIRAVTQCFGGEDPGSSHVIQGKIERSAPLIFGTPEPADGVLSSGDEISITFNESIRCDLILQADQTENNNVGLYDTETGDLIDADITCEDDKIVIVPNVANHFIENKILRVEVDSIQDLAGNKFGHAEWEFEVDRNSVRWVGLHIDRFVTEGTELTVIRGIQNVSGAVVSYSICEQPGGCTNATGLPDWVEVLPTEGVLAPGTAQAVTFKFSADLAEDDYLDTIYLHSAMGDEPMIVHFRVLCAAPQWVVDPTEFSYSMNLTVQLNIEGTLSSDNMDQVAVFVGSELRGVANIEYEPAPIDKHLAYLTVYSNSNVANAETLKAQIWDADACLLYGQVTESPVFVVDGVNGSPGTPLVLHTNGNLLRKIPIHTGWNWISFNLNVPNKAIGNVLASLQHPQNGTIKSQTQFSTYSSNAWTGSLTTLGYKSMYQLRSDAADTIVVIGAKLRADTVSIPVVAGWNWISYLPYKELSPNVALATLNPLNNDLIKSQTKFAQFVSGTGWVGNLDQLEAPNGYLLKIANAGTLYYPNVNLTGDDPLEQLVAGGGQSAVGSSQSAVTNHQSPAEKNGLWTVDPSQFEHNMNIIAVVGADANLLEEGDAIGAFAGDEVRGGNEPIWVESLQQWMVFLTVYANSGGEELTFKFYDSSAEDIHHLNETMPFAIDHLQGTVEEPHVFTLEMTGTATNELTQDNWFEVYPNPAGDHVFAAFGSKGNETAVLRISDPLGRALKSMEVSTVPGLNVVKWDTGDLATGSYFLTLTSDGETATKRVIK